MRVSGYFTWQCCDNYAFMMAQVSTHYYILPQLLQSSIVNGFGRRLLFELSEAPTIA